MNCARGDTRPALRCSETLCELLGSRSPSK
jgi:hypothetical protein